MNHRAKGESQPDAGGAIEDETQSLSFDDHPIFHKIDQKETPVSSPTAHQELPPANDEEMHQASLTQELDYHMSHKEEDFLQDRIQP